MNANVIALLRTADLSINTISGTGSAYDRLNAERQVFLDLFEAGTATATDVLRFVLLIDDCGTETVPGSEGIQWLWHNAERFANAVGNVEVFVETLLTLLRRNREGDEEHERATWLASRDILSTILRVPELMMLLSPEWRERMVSEVWHLVGAQNDWIAAAAQTGVNRDVMANAILTKLDRAKPKEPGRRTDMDDFLEFGYGHEENPLSSTLSRLGGFIDKDCGCASRQRESIRLNPAPWWTCLEQTVQARLDAIERGEAVPQRSYCIWTDITCDRKQQTEPEKWKTCFYGLSTWSVLTAEELELAMILCEERQPGCTVGLRAKLLRRLPEEKVDQLIAQAMANATSLGHIPDVELKRLSPAETQQLAERLAPLPKTYGWSDKRTIQFLLRILVDLPEADRRAFYEGTLLRVLENADAPSLYAAWRQLGLVLPRLESNLLARLENEGYGYGVIRREPNPAKSGLVQYVVRENNTVFVHQNHAHRYFPTVGDPVVFHREGRRLTPRVIAVDFIPVMKDREKY